ncbi:alginate export family protein [Marivirga harenae]|uniref:alginate export family protein n=1 Tax=Marivirga harenae TaxID=2010992 RepID=UPI0026DF1EB7|nr:alginate export family protein [Marivirga harenae]WKV12955.1 alginate export family protein [Marivirga harenae]|tara:strand:- start:71368 stop:72702 length:1335 start_codon:yes stop_codon:yes gene_type:complete
MKNILKFGLSLILAFSAQLSYAQFSVDGQIVQRAEYRNGEGRLIGVGQDPATFIAHRMRLQTRYEMDGFTFYASIQDVRTWGNTPQTKATDPFLSLHEAWAETSLGDYWKIKLGRQELNYDNARFLGNLDWALQARAHDFALIKYEKEKLKIHFGGGFNQDGQSLSGNLFFNPNQYKVAQMLRYENQWGDFKLSALFWNDGRQFIESDAAGNVINDQVNYSQTIGLPTIKYQLGNTLLSGFYYHQTGKDVSDRDVNAFDVSAQITQTLNSNTEKGSSFKATLGIEIISGTDNISTEQNNSFNPLYGTNHAHNGYMDLFFVGGRFANSVGLQDYYLKGRYQFNPKFFTQLDGHVFYSEAEPVPMNPVLPVGIQRLSKYLGTEIDLSFGYILNRAVSIQGGYSQIFASDTFEFLQGQTAYKNTQNWAYVMFIFRPTMKNRFIGVLF